MNQPNWLLRRWEKRRFELRARHGLCTRCGENKSKVGGTTVCSECFNKVVDEYREN